MDIESGADGRLPIADSSRQAFTPIPPRSSHPVPIISRPSSSEDVPTDEQIAAVDMFAKGDNMAIIAGAGCLAAESKVHVIIDGLYSVRPIAALALYMGGHPEAGIAGGVSGRVWVARADTGGISWGCVASAWCSGMKTTYSVTTETGRVIRASAQHPFLTADGDWVRLDQLVSGTVLQVSNGIELAEGYPLSPVLVGSDLVEADGQVLTFDRAARVGRIGLERVSSVVLYGEECTYDIEVADAPHNFVADGFVVHNTGKTATLVRIGRSVSARGVYIAYNRAAANDAGGRVSSNVSASTAHSLAFKAVGRFYSNRLAARRMATPQIARILGITAPFYSGEGKSVPVKVLVGMVMTAVNQFQFSDSPEISVDHVPIQLGLDKPGQEGGVVHAALQQHLLPYMRAAWKDLCSESGVLPYSHETYLKQWELSGPKINADFILFDEAQDANPAMVSILKRQSAQLVYVGDPAQNIYGFRNSYDALSDIPDRYVTKLTQSFRFGPAIANAANQLLGQLGYPLRLKGSNKIKSKLDTLTRPDIILCRSNAGAVLELLNCKDEHVSACLSGDTNSVERFVKAALSLQQDIPTTHPDLACFKTWEEVQQYVKEDVLGYDLAMLVNLVNRHNANEILQLLQHQPSPELAQCQISTVHRGKGLEWPKVRISGDFERRLKAVVNTPEEPGELRLAYVAVTRAANVLDPGVGVGDLISWTPNPPTGPSPDKTDLPIPPIAL